MRNSRYYRSHRAPNMVFHKKMRQHCGLSVTWLRADHPKPESDVVTRRPETVGVPDRVSLNVALHGAFEPGVWLG